MNYIEKLIRLGILDENIVAQKLRAVFRDLKDGQIRNQSDLLSRLAKMTPTDKVARLYTQVEITFGKILVTILVNLNLVMLLQI